MLLPNQHESFVTTPEPTTALPTVTLAGVPFAALTEAQAAEHIVRSGVAGHGDWVVTANTDHVRQYNGDDDARRLIDQADLVVADGTPLIWASRIARQPLPERVAGSNMIFAIAEEAATQGGSIFFLGGNPGTAEGTARILRERHPELRVAGTLCPEFGFDRDEARLAAIEAEVVGAEPDIVLVALGFPKQDRLIERLRAANPAPSYVGVGISFSFVCGEVNRAPEWMHGLGLEWIHRMTQEPRRLVSRYLRHDLPFALRLIAGALRTRAKSSSS